MKMTPAMILTAYAEVKRIEFLDPEASTKEACKPIADSLCEINAAIQSLIPNAVLSVCVKDGKVDGFKVDFNKDGKCYRSYIGSNMSITHEDDLFSCEELYIASYLRLLNKQQSVN